MLNIQYHVQDTIRREVHALAELETEHGVNLSWQNYLQLPESASDEAVATHVLEWATLISGYESGTVEVSSNRPAQSVKLEAYPSLQVQHREALTEQVQNSFKGMGLLG